MANLDTHKKMKLYYSSVSPFSRKVRVLVFECGLENRVEMVLTKVSPIQPNMNLLPYNPLIKLPILVDDDGLALYDSPVICEYLDGLHQGKKFYPADAPRRWNSLRLQALADGMLEAAVLAQQEARLRPEANRWQKFRDSQIARVLRGVAALDDGLATSDERLCIGMISALCCLSYLDFRLPDVDWRKGHNRVAAWYDTMSTRASVEATMLTD
jgi:glutathione S-transferase